MQRFPIHVVSAWIGNDPKTALKHYAQVTEADFRNALQNALQKNAAAGRNSLQLPRIAHEKTPEKPGFAQNPGIYAMVGIAGTGFQPATSRL